MRNRILHICALAGGAYLAACDKPPPAPVASPVKAATSMPATTQAIVPASRPMAVININGQDALFPAARMRLENDGAHLVAMLFSDDPPEALKSHYIGNSFYLRMELDVADAPELAQAEWRYQAPSGAEREDSPYGIFVAGRKTQLEPFDVRVQLRRDTAGMVNVLLAGEFRVIDSTSDRGPANVVSVAAELSAQVDKPGKP